MCVCFCVLGITVYTKHCQKCIHVNASLSDCFPLSFYIGEKRKERFGSRLNCSRHFLICSRLTEKARRRSKHTETK